MWVHVGPKCRLAENIHRGLVSAQKNTKKYGKLRENLNNPITPFSYMY